MRLGWKTGLEPATFGTTIRHSNQLSYIHHVAFLMRCKDTYYLLFCKYLNRYFS